jgi:hypothetical protein
VSSQYFRFSARRLPHAQRAALLEHLLARSDAPRHVIDWRSDAFRLIAPRTGVMPGLSPVALRALGAQADFGVPPGAWVYFATPVHYLADMSSVRMAADGLLSLTAAAAQVLAGDFNRVWHDAGIRLWGSASGRLFAISDRSLATVTQDPGEVLERPIENYLPGGADAARLRQLMSEIEMWLFEHEVNRQRAAQGLTQISGLWLWGGGAYLPQLPAICGWAAGSDPFFSALPHSATLQASSCGVIAVAHVPGSVAWAEVESRWLAPAIEQWRSGRLSRIELSAGDRSFAVTAAHRWRFWRRAAPWWEYFP